MLLAYDGSPTGKRILNFLVENAQGFQDIDIHVLTIAKSEGDSAKTQDLNSAKEQLEQAGFATTTSLLTGEPETEITQYVKQNQISLLLMGAYGHRRIRHLIIGSTTVQLLRSSQIPVLLFR